jgi:hypothetical protein
MPRRVTRGDLLRRTAGAGTALTFGGATAGLLAAPARAGLGDVDLALARVAVAVELLADAFYTRLIAARIFATGTLAELRRARFNEREHYRAAAGILTGAGQAPAQAGDFDYAFPARSFRSRGAAARLGLELETLSVGSYLGGVASLQSPELKSSFARIAASEAEHLTVFAGLALGKPVGLSFPDPVPFEQVSDELDRYLR